MLVTMDPSLNMTVNSKETGILCLQFFGNNLKIFTFRKFLLIYAVAGNYNSLFVDIADRKGRIWQQKLHRNEKSYLRKLKLLHNTTSMQCVLLCRQ